MSGGMALFVGDCAKVTNEDGTVLLNATKKDGLYIIYPTEDLTCQVKESSSLSGDNKFEMCHNRMGHRNGESLKQLQQTGNVTGMQTFSSFELKCTACIQGKQTRLLVPKKLVKSTSHCLELIHSDICGPMRTESLSKSLYFISFIDDYSRKIYVYLIRKKSEVLDKFKHFKNCVEN